MSAEANSPASGATPGRKVVGRPFQKGISGNPSGRPRIEPRIRKHARRYDMRLVHELWKIGTDPKVDADVRRRCLMDLQSIGNGRPPTTQELVGRPDAPLGPLVSLNFGAQPGQPLTPEQAYRAMVEGVIAVDPNVFRPAIEAKSATQEPGS